MAHSYSGPEISLPKHSLQHKREQTRIVINGGKSANTRGDQKVRRKVLLNRIAFIDCNENS